MKVATAFEMKQIDKTAIEQYKIPGCILMEHAALGVLEEIQEMFQHKLKDKPVCIFCGKGNNGGDGFAIARLLLLKSAAVTVILLCDSQDIQGDARIFYDCILKQNCLILLKNDEEAIKQKLCQSELIIDAIFGTGFHGEIQSDIQKIINWINQSQKPVLSVDIPSGIESGSQKLNPNAIQANKTVTFSLPKIANILYPAAKASGKVVVKDIGIPREIIEKQNIHFEIITKDWVKNAIPEKGPDTSKSDFGKAEIIAGSTGLTGAAYLSSTAALKAGCGLITLNTPRCVHDIMEVKLTECMTHPLPCQNGMLSDESVDILIKRIQKADAVLYGPGLGRAEDIKEVLFQLIQTSHVPLVIDADGLFALSQKNEILKAKKGDIIITPHMGEMARLIGKDINYVNENAKNVAKEYSLEYNIIVVLKGPHTIIATPDGTVYVNTNGNNGLSTGGTGDVLAGLITALLAQHYDPVKSACTAVFLHAHAADMGVLQVGKRSFTAQALLNYLPFSFNDVFGGCNNE